MDLFEKRVLSYPVDDFDPSDWLRFVQLKIFEQEWSKHRLTDDDLRSLEMLIMASPDRPPVLRGTGGLRKFRFAKSKSNRGKSGSFRICYVYFEEYGVVLLVTLFGKNEKDDLSDTDCDAIRSVIQRARALLEKGQL